MNTVYTPDLIAIWRGLRVIAVYRPNSKTFAATLTYRVGTFDDPAEAPGTAHFAEHLAFTGPNKQLAEQLGALGARVNGCTHYDYTEFPLGGHVDGLPMALELLANVAQLPDVTSELIADERDVFLHELQEDDKPASRAAAWDAFWRRTIGDPNWRRSQTTSVKIKRLTPELLTAFRKRYYHPANACLAIVCPLDRQELLAHLERFFPPEAADSQSAASPADCHTPFVHSCTVAWDFNPYIWVDVAQLTDDTTPIMRLSANIIGHLLGGGPHSELFRKLRTERSYAYYVNADDLPYLGGTIIHSFFCVHKRSIHESLDFVLTRLDEIAADGISEEQFEREKQRLLRWHELSLDHPQGLAAFLAYEALRPAAVSLHEEGGFHRKLNELSLDQLKGAAAKLLSKENRAVFAAGFLGPLARVHIRRRCRR